MATRRVFRIHILGQVYQAMPAGANGPASEALPGMAASRLIERAMLRPHGLAELQALGQAMEGRVTHSRPGALRLDKLKRAFEAGGWVLVAPRAAASIQPVENTERPADQVKAAKVLKTWIEFEVTDEDGRPRAGEPYMCMMPDGRIERGALDSKGRARFQGIDPGNCVFSLPDLDQESWQRAS